MKKTSKHLFSPFVLVLLAWAALTAGGCTFHHVKMGPRLDPRGTAMADGTTHFSQILNQLGAPAKISALPNGFVVLYEYYAVREWRAGGRIPIKDFEDYNPFKLHAGTGSARRQTLLLLFDQDGILRQQRHFQEGKEPLGQSIRLSFLTSYGNLIDTAYLDQRSGPDQWGMGLLKPFKEALNRQQDLESGLNGVEQVGTPTKVGQHTLELP